MGHEDAVGLDSYLTLCCEMLREPFVLSFTLWGIAGRWRVVGVVCVLVCSYSVADIWQLVFNVSL